MRALPLVKKRLRLAEILDHPFTRIWTFFGLANVHALRGNFDEAARLIERALVVAREWQLTIWFAYLDWGLGRAYTLSGRVTEGLALLENSLRAHGIRKTGNWESLLLAHLSEALFVAGRRDEACAAGKRLWRLLVPAASEAMKRTRFTFSG